MRSRQAESQEVQDRQLRQSGAGFLVLGVVSTLVLWRFHVMSAEVFDVEIGPFAIAVAICGALGIAYPSCAARWRAYRAAPPEPKATPRAKPKAARADNWKVSGGLAVTLAVIWLTTDVFEHCGLGERRTLGDDLPFVLTMLSAGFFLMAKGFHPPARP